MGSLILTVQEAVELFLIAVIRAIESVDHAFNQPIPGVRVTFEPLSPFPQLGGQKAIVMTYTPPNLEPGKLRTFVESVIGYKLSNDNSFNLRELVDTACIIKVGTTSNGYRTVKQAYCLDSFTDNPEKLKEIKLACFGHFKDKHEACISYCAWAKSCQTATPPAPPPTPLSFSIMESAFGMKVEANEPPQETASQVVDIDQPTQATVQQPATIDAVSKPAVTEAVPAETDQSSQVATIEPITTDQQVQETASKQPATDAGLKPEPTVSERPRLINRKFGSSSK